MPTPITNLDDIKLLVNTFYAKVQKDDLIGPIFNGIIQDRWEEHLSKMYAFWQTILLDQHTYSGRPFPPHVGLPVQADHFQRWMMLFTQTVDELFEGEKANEAKLRGEKMATMFLSKIQYFREINQKPLM